MPDTIEELQIEIGAKAVKANDAIDRLIGKLDRLTTSLSKVDGASLRSLSNGVERLSGAMQTMRASVKTADFTRLARNLERIGSLDSSALNSVSNSIQSISNTLNSIGSVSANSQAVADMTKNIAKLGGKSVQTAIANMPQLANAVNNLMETLSKAPKVSQNIIDMTNALANLAAQGSKVGSSSRTLVSGLNKTRTAAERTAKSTASLASAFGKFYATWFMVIRGIKTVWKDIESSMDYIETSNYFNVALSQIGNQFEKAGYETADAYTAALTERLNQLNTRLTGYTVGESGEALFSGNIGLGIDIEKMMNFQAKTLAVTNSVGLLGEASVETTKAISMLAGDLSSLTNLDIESVMTNLSSGLIGQSRSLYKYGIDITNNTLQQYALAEGLEKSVQEMTQAEKMQLRLIAILDQSKVSHADLANTINSVANQYRVFNQQVDNLGRTLGNLLLPIVKNVLPYVNGLVIALNNLFTTLGFKMYGDTWLKDLQDGISGGVQEGFEDTEDAIEDTTEALNKLKNGVRGFDVLNVISSSSKSGVNGELENTIDLTEAITKAVENYEKSWNKAFENMENKTQEIADKIEKSLGKISDFLFSSAESVKNISEVVAPFLKGFSIGFTKETLILIEKALGAISDLLENVDPQKAQDIGEGIGKTLALFVAYKGVGTIAAKIANGVKLLASALKNPIFQTFALTAGILKLADMATDTHYDSSNIDGYASALENLASAYEELANVDLDANEDAEYLEMIYSRWEKLASKAGELTDGEQAILKEYGDKLKEICPEVTSLIDENGKAFEGVGEQIQKVIDKSVLWYKVQAAQDYLVSLSKIKFEIEFESESAKDKINEIVERLREINPSLTEEKIMLYAKNLVKGYGRSSDIMTGIEKQFGIERNWLGFRTKEGREIYNEVANLMTDLSGVVSLYEESQKTLSATMEKIEYASNELAEVQEAYNNKVTDGKTSTEKYNKALEGTGEAFESVTTKISQRSDVIFGKFGLLGKKADELKEKIKSLDGLDATVTLNVKGGFGKSFSNIAIPGYATGGYPNTNFPFFVGENGPELYGGMKGRTAVANNNSITEGIEEAAYRGMARALSESKTSGSNVNVYLEGDAKGLFKTVKKEANEQYRRTGVPAFDF